MNCEHIDIITDLIKKGANAETIIKLNKEKYFSTDELLFLNNFTDNEINKIKKVNASDPQIERLEKVQEQLISLCFKSLLSPKRPDTICNYMVKLFPNMLRIFKGNKEELAVFITFLQKKSDSNENKSGNKNLSKQYIAKLMSMLVHEKIVEFGYYKRSFSIVDIHKSLLELTSQNPIFTPKIVKRKMNPSKVTTSFLTSFRFYLALPFISIYITIKSFFVKDKDKYFKDIYGEEWEKDYKEWKEKSIKERLNTFKVDVDEHEMEMEIDVDENDGVKRDLIRNLIETINIDIGTRAWFSQKFVIDKAKASDEDKKIIDDLKEEYDRHREEIIPIFQAL